MSQSVTPLDTVRPSRLRSDFLISVAATLVVMLVLHTMVFAVDPMALGAFALFGISAFILWVKLPLDYPHSRFGACNAVTLLRAGLGASLLTPLLTGDPAAGPWSDWVVVGVAVIALSLDGVDGWLARRSGLASSYGARFDMEVDAALALILALHALADGLVGPVVLLLGLMRYAFVAASYPLPWLSAPLPESFGRKLVCVIQIAALIALQLPFLTVPVAQWIAFGAVLALLWSFGRDTIWLWSHRT